MVCAIRQPFYKRLDQNIHYYKGVRSVLHIYFWLNLLRLNLFPKGCLKMLLYYIMAKTLRKNMNMRKRKGADGGYPRNKKSVKGKSGSIAGLAKVVIPKFLEMINTIKIYHWKTSSYSTHKATDQLFEDLNKKTDEFVEVMLGKSEINRDAVLYYPSVKISMFSNNVDCRRIIDSYKQFLLDLPRNKNFNVMANVDLLAIRDEILALLNQFLYLLTLR